jgi:hypothetical protein
MVDDQTSTSCERPPTVDHTRRSHLSYHLFLRRTALPLQSIRVVTPRYRLSIEAYCVSLNLDDGMKRCGFLICTGNREDFDVGLQVYFASEAWTLQRVRGAKDEWDSDRSDRSYQWDSVIAIASSETRSASCSVSSHAKEERLNFHPLKERRPHLIQECRNHGTEWRNTGCGVE